MTFLQAFVTGETVSKIILTAQFSEKKKKKKKRHLFWLMLWYQHPCYQKSFACSWTLVQWYSEIESHSDGDNYVYCACTHGLKVGTHGNFKSSTYRIHIEIHRYAHIFHSYDLDDLYSETCLHVFILQSLILALSELLAIYKFGMKCCCCFI